MKIIRETFDKVACTGDLLVLDNGDGMDAYLMFCESKRSIKENENNKFYFHLVDMRNGSVIDYELSENEDIEIGTLIEDYGEVVDIIENQRLALKIIE